MARMFRKGSVKSSFPKFASLVLCALFVLASCTGTGSNRATATATIPAHMGKLTPYHSPSPSATGAPTGVATETPTSPPPSPTPITHEVKKGEDLSGLALRYGVELADLIAANPTVNPRAMSVGTVLIIPPSKTPVPTELSSQPNALQTPTPIAIALGPLRCTRSRDDGIWCFQGTSNNQTFPIESLTGTIVLRGGNGETVAQKAALPLDTLKPGASLPLAAYFPPEDVSGLTDPILATSELHTALPYRDDGRYISSQAQNQKVFLSEDGLSAEVTLDVTLVKNGMHAKRVWVAAVAYDEQDNIIGVRRWEKPGEEALDSGETLPVSLHLYSTGGEIVRVDVITEARP